MSENYFWQTERIRLRQIEAEDWEVFFNWDFDSETMRDVDELHFPQSSLRSKEWAEQEAKSMPENDAVKLAIVLRETGKVIGIINSHHCDRRVGNFMYGIAIRRDFQRKGYASEAIILLLRYFFTELRYQKCTIDVHGWNEPSIALHEKLGFVKEGQVRRALFTKGQHFDRLIYGITIEEFEERYA